MKSAFVFVLLLVPLCTHACLNLSGTTHDGHIVSVGMGIHNRLRSAMKIDPRRETATSRFGRHGIEEDSSGSENEVAAIDMIFAGDLSGAIKLLTHIEDTSPGLYSTAANLGTAYELIGDNENALKWIMVGIARNPESHSGSEWLHALILEAKIEAQRHPGQPLPRHLLEVPETVKPDTMIAVKGRQVPAQDVWTALAYQLEERMVFVKPKDPYVADLLYSFALLEASLHTAETAQGLLELAEQYGFPDHALVMQQQERLGRTIVWGQIRFWTPILLGVALFVYICRRKKWGFFLTRSAYKAHKAAEAASTAQAVD